MRLIFFMLRVNIIVWKVMGVILNLFILVLNFWFKKKVDCRGVIGLILIESSF